MSNLRDKLIKNSTVKDTAILSESKFFIKKDMIQTMIPAVNIALSGKIDGGLTPGLTMVAGESKHFKTAFLLVMLKAYLDKYPDAIALFYDSEFGTPQSYFETFEIDLERVVHTPITNIEQLKFDIMQQFEKLDRKDHVFVGIDSIGNLASKKEIEDALEGKSVADMTRAKQLKSLFRMVTPHLTIKDIPMVVVNHTYKTMEMYAKDVIGGGKGSYYSADTIFIIGRQQEKLPGKEVTGYTFVINIEKSRYVKEKSKIPVSVSFGSGISRWSGLLDLASESGNVLKTRGKGYYYQRVDLTTGVIEEEQFKEKQTNTAAFWDPILKDEHFKSFVEKKYTLVYNNIMDEEDSVEEVYEDLEESEA